MSGAVARGGAGTARRKRAGDGPVAPGRDAWAAEWTKFRTAPGNWALPAALIVLTVVLSAVTAAAVGHPGPDQGADRDLVRTSLIGVTLGQALAAALGVGVISGEHASGMIRTTLAAVPRRGLVLAAKAGVVTAVVTVAGTVAVAGSLLAGRLLLSGQGTAVDLADPATRRAALGSVLYLVLVALLGLGIGTVARDPAAATGAVLGLLYLFPVVANLLGDPHWQRHLQQVGPMSAGLCVQATTAAALRGSPLSPVHGLAVLAAWSAAALLLAAALFRHRDP